MLRSHLEAVEKATRVRVERLHRQCPPAAMYVWEWFLKLHPRRLRTDAGPMGLTYQEIASWAHLSGSSPSAREVDLLLSMDNLFFDVRSSNG